MLSHLLARYGAVFVLGLVFLESTGLPFPGETVLLTGSAFAASGRLVLWQVIAGAATGAIGGGMLGYWLGRRGVSAGFVAKSRHVEAGLRRTRGFLERHGGKAVLFSRFVALARSFMGIVAGAGGMRVRRFAVFNAAGALLWAVGYGALGYAFGAALPRLERALGAAGGVVAIALAVSVTTVLAIRAVQVRHREIFAWAEGLWGRTLGPPVSRWVERHPAAWKWVTTRFTPAEYLGLHLTIGIVVAGGAVWLFGGILEDVLAGDPLTGFDLGLAAWLHNGATPRGIAFFTAVSMLGSPAAWVVLGSVVTLALALRRRWLLLRGWVAALAGGGVLDLVLKTLVHRPRPYFAHPFTTATGFSFPSGHSMGSLIGYGMLAYFAILSLRRTGARVAVGVAASLLVLLIGFSRLYLGVHYFSDVVAGFTGGVVWLSVCISGLEVARRRPQ